MHTPENNSENTPGRDDFMDLSEERLEAFKRIINNTIHELVFIVAFMDQGDIEATQNALMTAQGNLEQVAEEYESLRAQYQR